MSRADEFLSALRADPDLEAKLSAASTSEEAKKVVTDAGFADVSSADVEAAIAVENDGDELSEHQLAAASGAGGLSSGSFWMHSDPGWGVDPDGGGW